ASPPRSLVERGNDERRHPRARRRRLGSAVAAPDERDEPTEREGFEPSDEVDPRHAISSRARSTAPAPLRAARRVAARPPDKPSGGRAGQICQTPPCRTGTSSPSAV